MVNDELNKYSGASSENSNGGNPYELISVSTQLMLTGGFTLAVKAMNYLNKANKDRNWGPLNFITPLNRMEEIKLEKKYKYCKKIYKASSIAVESNDTLLALATIIRGAFSMEIAENNAVSTITPQATAFASLIPSLAYICSTIAGRLFICCVPEESVFSYDVTTVEEVEPNPIPVLLGMNVFTISENLSQENAESEHSMREVMAISRKKESQSNSNSANKSKGKKSNLKHSQSERDLKKYIGLLPLKDQIQLTEETSMKIAKNLINPSGKPIGPMYLGVGDEGYPPLEIAESEIKKL